MLRNLAPQARPGGALCCGQHPRRAAQKLAQQEERDQEAADEARGYQSITVETFVLDGKDLASEAAKVTLSGIFTREGNLDFLYANRGAVLMATGRYGSRQPNVPLLTDNAAREFRRESG
jgi:hypothetical protein